MPRACLVTALPTTITILGECWEIVYTSRKRMYKSSLRSTTRVTLGCPLPVETTSTAAHPVSEETLRLLTGPTSIRRGTNES